MLTTKIPRFLLFCAMGFLLVSCAHRLPAFSPAARPDPNSTILYGRFSMGHNYACYNKLALWLQNADSRQNLYLYFDPDHPFYAVQVKAGRYRLAGFVAVDRKHEVQGRRELRSADRSLPIFSPFTAAAGSQIYLGDFAGEVNDYGMMFEWKVSGMTNNFGGTTVEFREKYPNLRTAPATSLQELPAAAR